jgi:hypothetical protein
MIVVLTLETRLSETAAKRDNGVGNPGRAFRSPASIDIAFLVSTLSKSAAEDLQYHGSSASVHECEPNQLQKNGQT